jgi:NADH:ubiquinone oxidoreductase subunit F (NADH-binding)/NADH:ubiquinone oxidoreductase subunit E
MIVQELVALQHEYGYLPDDALQTLAQRLSVPLYRLQEVASFFPHFRRTPPAKVHVQICRDMSCHLRGAGKLLGECGKRLSEGNGHEIHVDGVSCLGRCDRAPAAMINEQLFVGRSAEELCAIAGQLAAGQQVEPDSDAALAVQQPKEKRAGGAAWNIDFYDGQPRYEAVKKFIANPDPNWVLTELKAGDLRGMGGAGAWAHQKWNDVWKAPGDEKYVVCNADESEPGTFKDRELLLRTPYLIVEGVILAGLMFGAKRGYIYIRHEYPEQIAAVNAAILQAEAMNVCGQKILGTTRDFPVEVFVSPGGYICGEQSALIEAMQDHRAEPRNRPPQLETNGLWDKPTLLSNVETFAWAPAIAVKGGAWFAGQGTNGCKGMRFFSISGDLERPGAYEVPNGISLRALIDDYAGGMRGKRKLKAFAASGPSGGFLPPTIALRPPRDKKDLDRLTPWVRGVHERELKSVELVDIPLDLQVYRELGLMLGAGMVVYAEGTDLMDQAQRSLEFFRNESCGKCVPCRIGSQKLVEIGTGLLEGQFNAPRWTQTEGLVKELGRTMEVTSICGLGQVASNPLTSLLRYFPEEISRRVKGQ